MATDLINGEGQKCSLLEEVEIIEIILRFVYIWRRTVPLLGAAAGLLVSF